MPSVNPLAQIGLALSGLPEKKENVANRYIVRHSNESKKCKDVSAKFFYDLGQFFLTLIGCSDKQILKRSFRSATYEIGKNMLQTLRPGLQLSKKELRVLKKQAHKVKINVKDAMQHFVNLNKVSVNIPKDTLDKLIKDAKTAAEALKKGDFEPTNKFLTNLTLVAPRLGFDPRIVGNIPQMNPLQQKA